MEKAEVRVRSEGGLHLRKAADVVLCAQRFRSAITLCHKRKSADACSILQVLCLGVASYSDLSTCGFPAACCRENLFPLRSAGNYWDTHFARPTVWVPRGRPLCGRSHDPQAGAPRLKDSKTRSARCLGYPAACSKVIYSPPQVPTKRKR